MYSYIKGIITEINNNYICLENNGIGYLIFTASPYSFKLNNEEKIYLYQCVREDELSLYGFKELREKELFLKLIAVKGLGPKMALPILASNTEQVIEAIENGNIEYLKKFPKIGDKVARQIVLDLKNKLVSDNNNAINNDLTDALVALGYKQNDIKKILPNITSVKLEDQIKEALRLLLK